MVIEDRVDKYLRVSLPVKNALNRRKISLSESYEDVLRRILKLPKRKIKN